MLPEAQKEVLLGRQDLCQLWGSESDSNVTAVPGKDGEQPVPGCDGGHVLFHSASFLENRGWQPFKWEEGFSKKRFWVPPKPLGMNS